MTAAEVHCVKYSTVNSFPPLLIQEANPKLSQVEAFLMALYKFGTEPVAN